ncbi:uncharacterized protein ALTATR162_LOCUS12151 [Alternaria atra]|uniref:Chromo domain-containing protein n=1 Tax=Alternaria atra TaxID=119953 RepID=A0A8J2IIF8_9PLEO|nr:uncharacterized protein ALTATR162_LOCUS12151 [Alternaria atra]CAG5190207.1 unnamed protein product [Alternaria atra]
MVSKRAANKRKRTSNTLARNKRRRITQLAYTSASEPHRDHGPASEIFWAARRILKDNGSCYLVEWEGIDPGTGRLYEPTWEPHDFVTPALEAEWKEIIPARSTDTGHTHSQAQSFEEADNRMQSLSGSPELVTSRQPPTKRRSFSSLFLEPQQSACALEGGNSYTCGVILARQNNVNLTISTTTTLEETSGSNQRNPATANVSGHTNEDLSATDPAALGLRHSLHAQSSACIEKVGSVGIMQLSSHPDPVGKLQDAGCKESELPENPSQEGLEPLELARRESQRAHACTLEEKGLPTSALLTTRKPLETQEQQEMQGELEILGAMPSAPANEVVHKEPELQAEADVVSYTKTWREPVLEKAALVLLQGGTVEEQSKALVSSERSPGRLSKDCWTHEKAVIQHAPAEPDVSDELTRLLARSERSISSSSEQSESNLQNLKSRADTLPVLAIDRTPIAPSALSSQLGLRLDTKITAEQAFAKQGVNAPARGRDAKTCPLPAAALAVCARHTSEQNSLPETETGGLPAPPALNRSVRDLEVVPDREVQVRIANSMHTIDGEQTAPITRDSFTLKPPNCGEADQDSASRRFGDRDQPLKEQISFQMN